mmetsp:Transcript_51619/g.135461  ORF Transcript_51619/g.135461 Transcript_51619/m.135461 type:complete len:438 (-) Transcript_51619:52-1365(-)
MWSKGARQPRDPGAAPKTHLEDGLEIPDHLGSEVTFDQKKRLARLAKMGIGPVARTPLAAAAVALPKEEAVKEGTPEEQAQQERERRIRLQLQERRASMLEHERRLRAQEEQRRLEEEREAKEREESKKKRPRAGLSSLGAVQPREAAAAPARPSAAFAAAPPGLAAAFGEDDSAPQRRPVRQPASASNAVPAGAAVGSRMAVKISSETAERVVGSSSSGATGAAGGASPSRAAPPRRPDDAETAAATKDTSGGGVLSAEAEVLAALRSKRPTSQAAKAEEEERRRKAKKRKKKPTKKEAERESSESSKSEDEEEDRRKRSREGLNAMAMKQVRDGGISWKMMNVESVKGKVSNDNRHMTDADLERRFSNRESESAAGMMTEEQVLAMMKSERKGQKDAAAAARRAQKELAEWTQLKAERMARAGSDDKERLVVSRR